MFLVAVAGALGQRLTCSCAEQRRIAESQRAYVQANCPDLVLYDECNARLARLKAEQDEREREQRAAQRVAQQEAENAARAARRDEQNRFPALIDGILSTAAEHIGMLDVVPRCGPQLKGWPKWAAENLHKAHVIGEQLDDIVGDPNPRQREVLQHLHNSLAAAEICGPCTDESKAACERETSELEKARRLLPRTR